MTDGPIVIRFSMLGSRSRSRSTAGSGCTEGTKSGYDRSGWWVRAAEVETWTVLKLLRWAARFVGSARLAGSSADADAEAVCALCVVLRRAKRRNQGWASSVKPNPRRSTPGL